MITSVAHGSQTATIDTEHTLDTQTIAGTYVLSTDMTNLAAEDIVILRLYKKVVHDGNSILAYEKEWAGVQTEKAKESIPIVADSEVHATLEQTDGTGRVFPWSLLKL